MLIVVFFNLNLSAQIKPLILKNTLEFKGQSYSDLKSLPEIKVGDTIATKARSYFVFSLTQEKGVATFKVGPNSTFTISEAKSLSLEKGSVFSKFIAREKSDDIKFEVRTKMASLGVRGTYFFTSYGKSDDDIWMCVKEGLVEVSDVKKKEKKTVKAGEGVFINQDKVGKPQFYPWTKKINWNLDEGQNIEQDLSLDKMYTDLLDVDYN